MSLHRLYGTPTLGGHLWWDTTYTYGGWRIQHHKTENFRIGLKAYRLLDPYNCLIASADSEIELREYLNHLLKY